jgi:putative lipoprotein
MRIESFLAVGMVLGCAEHSPGPADQGRITGTVAYRERMALPADAVVQVQLYDVSVQDVAAPLIAETTVEPAGRQVPLPFELRYDPAKIDSGRRYAVRATIRSEGRLMFTTSTAAPVLTHGSPGRADLLLVRVAAQPETDAGAGPTGLWGSTWVLEDIGGSGVIDGARATLEFPEVGKVAGRGSCNRFFGSVRISGDSMTFGPLGSTRMACAEAVMNQETRYLAALAGAERYSIEGSVLLVHARDLPKPLRFTRETP